MDGKSIAILKLYNQRTQLSCYDIGVIFDTSPLSFSSNVNELRKLGYIVINDLEKLESNSDSIGINTKLHITQSGKSYLYDLKENKRKFILQSVTVPFVVSVISSIITAIITVVLTK